MGAWGVEPFENDDASDFAHAHIDRLIAQARNEDTLRAAAAMVAGLAKGGVGITEAQFAKLIRGLERIRTSEWIRGWVNPRNAARALQKQIDELNRLADKEQRVATLRRRRR